MSDLGGGCRDFLVEFPLFIWEAAEAQSVCVSNSPKSDRYLAKQGLFTQSSGFLGFFFPPCSLHFSKIGPREAAWPLIPTWDN